MKPNPDLVSFLGKNKCKVAYRGERTFMYLWIEYGQLTKNKPGQGLDIWGNSQQIFEKINSVVFRYYPTAELASQSGNRSVVYRVSMPRKS